MLFSLLNILTNQALKQNIHTIIITGLRLKNQAMKLLPTLMIQKVMLFHMLQVMRKTILITHTTVQVRSSEKNQAMITLIIPMIPKAT